MDERSGEELMRSFLTGEEGRLRRFRGAMRHVPSRDHCKLCAAPFDGPTGLVFRHIGFPRFTGNPAICSSCIRSLQKMGVAGAEIPVSLLFADIRGSTALGERLSPSDFRSLLATFYQAALPAVLLNDGLVDKFVGDEVIGLFFAGVSGQEHAAAAVRAARDLLDRVGRADVSAIGSIPVGAAVHTGVAFVGSSGTDGQVNDFTALGDAVNTTARLAGEAEAGELLVTVDALAAAHIDMSALERRVIEVRGRAEPVEAASLRARETD